METVNWLFVDLNSYFASIEQELRPELRGQPIVIIPIDADVGCCIAASYQAKAYGIKTGCRLEEAKQVCPHVLPVVARPRLYVEYHHMLIEAIERCVPVQSVMSCDEFACRLIGRERNLQRAVEIAYEVKNEIRKVGSTLRCSVGLAPNRLLAKIAGDMQKPDGLMIFTRNNLPTSLFTLPLKDIPGIGSRMEERIRAAGIHTVRELCALSRERAGAVWGNVWGERIWLWMHGEDFLEPEPRPLQSLSRQHIIPPQARTQEKTRGIAIKLLLSTARRMRRYGLWAGSVGIHVGYQEGQAFEMGIRIPPSQDFFTIQEHFLLLWKRAPKHLTPSDISVILSDLGPEPQANFFEAEVPKETERLTTEVDKLNLRFGLNTVYPGSIHSVRDQAPTRIPFGPPPPLEEFDDPADNVRPERKSVRRDQANRPHYEKPRRA